MLNKIENKTYKLLRYYPIKLKYCKPMFFIRPYEILLELYFMDLFCE